MRHPVLQVRDKEGVALALPALMDELGRRLTGRRHPRGAILGVRCDPQGQWIIDLGVGFVRGSTQSVEVDERPDLDLVIAGPEKALTDVLNGNPTAEHLAAVTLQGDANALGDLITML